MLRESSDHQPQNQPLTPELIRIIETDPKFSHPILSAISPIDRLRVLAGEYKKTEKAKREKFVTDSYLFFLANALLNAGEFRMEPSDVIGVWSRLTREGVLPRDEAASHPGRAIATLASAAYMIYPLGRQRPRWKTFPAMVLKAAPLWESLPYDPKILSKLTIRLNHIQGTNRRIREYQDTQEEKGAPVEPLIPQIIDDLSSGLSRINLAIGRWDARRSKEDGL